MWIATLIKSDRKVIKHKTRNNRFVVPSTKEEFLQITYNIQTWLQLANTDLQLRNEKESAEIALDVLEGIRMHYEEDKYNTLSCDIEIKIVVIKF